MSRPTKIEVEIDGQWVEFDPAVHAIERFDRIRTSEVMTKAEAIYHFGEDYFNAHLKQRP